MPPPHMLVPIKIFVILLPLHLLRLTRNVLLNMVDKAIQGSTFAIFCKPHFVPLSIPQAHIICQIMLTVFKIYFHGSAKTFGWDVPASVGTFMLITPDLDLSRWTQFYLDDQKLVSQSKDVFEMNVTTCLWHHKMCQNQNLKPIQFLHMYQNYVLHIFEIRSAAFYIKT